MGNTLTKIVLDTEGLEPEPSYKSGYSPAINYQARNSDRWETVFLVPTELVAQTEEQGNQLEVTLREGMTPKIKYDQLFIKTNQPDIHHVKIPSWLGGGRIHVPIPLSRRVYYCTELKYLVSIQMGDKVLYQRPQISTKEDNKNDHRL